MAVPQKTKNKKQKHRITHNSAILLLGIYSPKLKRWTQIVTQVQVFRETYWEYPEVGNNPCLSIEE